MFTSNNAWARAARLVLTLALTLSWSGFSDAAPTGDADADKQQKQLMALLQRLSDISRRELAKPGANPADVKQKARELGNDVDKLFAFVRDEVRFEPYQGVLRGGAGTLLARSGNSFDKAILLQELLEASGVSTRLVQGTLAADKAAALVDQFLAGKITAGPIADAGVAPGAMPVSPEGQAFLQTIAKETGLSSDALNKTVARDAERAAVVTAEAWSIVDRETPALQKRLADAKVQLGRPVAGWREQLQSRATQHVWVEMQDPAEAGKWVALDPTIAGSQRGQAAAQGQPFKIAEADEHTVTLKLIYRAKDENRELISVPIPARYAATHYAQLVVNPADDLPPASQLLAMSKEQLIKTMGSIKKFQPELRLGGKSYFGKVFDLKGGLHDISPDGRVAGAAGVGAAAGGLFGGGALGGGGTEKEPDGAGTFQELFVSIELASPGQPVQKQKRDILSAADVVGPRIKSPLLTWDVLIQPAPVGGKYVSFQSVRTMVAAMNPMLAKESIDRKGVDDVASARPEPYPGLLLTLALMRERAMAKTLADQADVALLWDRPFVAFAERTFCMNPEAGAACGNARVDIVDNTLTYVPRQAGGESAAATATMRQGVFDTAAEALALRESLNTPGAPRLSAVYSPIDDLHAARNAGDALGVVQAGPNVQGVSVSSADKEWIAGNEPSGRMIVAPSQTPDGTRPGWWTVDPQTGVTLGRASGGRGEAMSEKAIVTNLVGFAVCMISPVWDAASGAGQTTKGALKVSLNMVGCIAGCIFGFGGAMATSAKGAENLGLMWAIISGAFAVGDKLLG